MINLNIPLIKIKSAASYFPDEEIGGIILEDGTVEFFKNISKNKKSHYLANLAETSKFEDRVYCTFHTHVGESDHNLSKYDVLISEKTKTPMLVYCPKINNYTFYEPTGLKIPLIGRPFILGILDCVELVKDYYKDCLNIDLPDDEYFFLRMLSYEDMAKSSYNKEENLNIFIDYYKRMGFRETDDLKRGDILFFAEKNIKPACHVYVYDGDSVFIDQPSRGVSRKRTLKNLTERGKIFTKAIKIMRYRQ